MKKKDSNSRNTCTQPPRLRDGQQIPGGKYLRRAKKKLLARTVANDKTWASLNKTPRTAFKAPGSMKA